MKKSLAIKLENSGSNPSPKLKLSTKPQQGETGNKPKLSLKVNVPGKPNNEKTVKEQTQTSYRDKNLSALPASLLNALSSLTALDISHNKLTDPQIQLLLSSCPRLETLCIEKNLITTIPASLQKLKSLQNFRHDWVELNSDATYESPQNMKLILTVIHKPNLLTKNNGVLGVDFESYCQNVTKTEMNDKLIERIKNSSCSEFAKEKMIESINNLINNNNVDKDDENTDIDHSENKSEQQMMENIKFRKVPENERKENTSKADISSSNQKIKSFSSEKQINQEEEDFPEILYQHKDMPLHMLFSRYDKNPNGAIDIDRLLLKGYNPNIYDHNGLSAYHIIVIFRQEKALERLIEISFKNPGFFDLEIPSMKEGRNILHFSVFLKDLAFTKALIDFGLPIDSRDNEGLRINHLAEQNYQFTILLRKALKEKSKTLKTPSFFTYPEPLARKYCRHPPRVTQESNYQIFENKNLNLLQMYEAAVGQRGNRS